MAINCPNCTHFDGHDCAMFGRQPGMAICPYAVERKPRNRFERIKAMSLEELADYHGAATGQRTEDVIRWLKEEIADV
jgi:hypothetical protein